MVNYTNFRLVATLVLCAIAKLSYGFDCNGQPDGTICVDGDEIHQAVCISNVCNQDMVGPDTEVGTISSSGAAVTGSGTDFLNAMLPGWIVNAGGQSRIIASITDATHLTTAGQFTPALAAGTSYTGQSPIGLFTNNGLPTLFFSGDGRIGLHVKSPAALLEVGPRPAPASVTSGTGTLGQDGATITGQTGGATSAAGAVGGGGGGVTLKGAPGGNSTGASGVAGDGGEVLLQGGAAGTGALPGAGGGVALIAAANGKEVLGVNRVPAARIQSVFSQADANLASTTDVQILSSSIKVELGRTESFHISVRLNNAASGARTYTCTLRRGGSSCTSGSTLVTDSTAVQVCGNSEIRTLTWMANEASPSDVPVTYRVCCNSSSATGTQTTEYQQLDVFEF